MGRINNRYIFPELHGDRQAQVPVMECSVCGGEIYEGEDYFHVGDEGALNAYGGTRQNEHV